MADFSMAGLGFSALTTYIEQDTKNDIAQMQADSANGIRAANNAGIKAVNEANAAVTKLQRWAQGVRNSRVYEAVAKNQEAMTTNFNRARDARTRSNFATSIRQAEETGRQAASAAAAGITGSVVDVINMTSRIRNTMQDQARLTAEKQIGYDENKAEFEQRWAILDQLDNSLIFDRVQLPDNSTNTAKNVVNPFSAAIAGLGTKGLQQIGTSVSDFFKTPTMSNDVGSSMNF